MISVHASWFGYEGLPFAECFRMAKQAGFDGVLLWWDDDNGADFRDQPEMARREDLWVENIHAPIDGLKHIWKDTAAGQVVFERYLGCADDCAAYEIPTMVMHVNSGASLWPMSKLGIERFKRIVERAEQKGVNVAVENLRSGDVKRVTVLLEQIDSPRFGFCFDSGHHYAWTPEINLLNRFGHRLMALHLHDNDGSADQHRLPFDGTIDWKTTMAAIAQTGYQNPTTLEVLARKPWYADMPPQEFLNKAYERALKLDQLRNITI